MIPVEDVYSFRLYLLNGTILRCFSEVSERLPAPATALSRVRSLKLGISTSDWAYASTSEYIGISILFDNIPQSSYMCSSNRNVVLFFLEGFISKSKSVLSTKKCVSFWMESVQISIILDTKIKLQCCNIWSSHFSIKDFNTPRNCVSILKTMSLHQLLPDHVDTLQYFEFDSFFHTYDTDDYERSNRNVGT